ncbi:MAG: hypothetical protein K0R49_1583 [Burkholderiales bacterium]|jgi:hypothetical protein|nr:hypothetical protein [Burkholderiales bacterium]
MYNTFLYLKHIGMRMTKYPNLLSLLDLGVTTLKNWVVMGLIHTDPEEETGVNQHKIISEANPLFRTTL